MERVEFDLEEYRALRAEVIQSMDDGNKILAFGLAAIGLVVASGLNFKDSLLGLLVLGFFLPILSGLVLSLWFAAQERIARASYYLSGIEARIKAVFDDASAVSWEAWLRGRKPNGRSEHFWSTEHAGIGLFGVIITSSILMGLVAGGSSIGFKIKGLVLVLSLTICTALFINVLRRFKNWKRWLSTHYDPENWESRLK
jgi:hypothetical protein